MIQKLELSLGLERLEGRLAQEGQRHQTLPHRRQRLIARLNWQGGIFAFHEIFEYGLELFRIFQIRPVFLLLKAVLELYNIGSKAIAGGVGEVRGRLDVLGGAGVTSR
jgi:hypothetical protein